MKKILFAILPIMFFAGCGVNNSVGAEYNDPSTSSSYVPVYYPQEESSSSGQFYCSVNNKYYQTQSLLDQMCEDNYCESNGKYYNSTYYAIYCHQISSSSEQSTPQIYYCSQSSCFDSVVKSLQSSPACSSVPCESIAAKECQCVLN